MSSKLSESVYVIYAARAIACAPVALGVNAIFRPQMALSMLQFPSPSDPAARKLALNLMRVYGARTIIIGLGMGIPAILGDRKTLAWFALGSTITAIVDGFVSKDQIQSGEWGHWGAIPIGAGLWAVLMGFFD